MNKYILDASALLALINLEPGHNKIAKILHMSFISSVNLCEVITTLHDKLNIEISETQNLVDSLITNIIDFDYNIALEAAKLRKNTKQYGLSFGDRACIATGIHHDMQIYTADRAWSNLNMENIEIIR